MLLIELTFGFVILQIGLVIAQIGMLLIELTLGFVILQIVFVIAQIKGLHRLV
jgi:hypothetical protein